MLEQELVKLSGLKLASGALLSVGGLSAVALGGFVAWKVWNKKATQPEQEVSAPTEEKQDDAAKILHAELQAEIDALSAEKSKLAQQVDALKTEVEQVHDTLPPIEQDVMDQAPPKTHFKLDMLQQLIRENLALRKAAI